jgi:DNA-binding response OmpR family regulator
MKILIVEGDDAAREFILQKIHAPNCVVEVARDEDEAVVKAAQQHPQLIIVKQHSPLQVDEKRPRLSASRVGSVGAPG